VDTPEDIEAIREYIKDFDYVAYDCETTGIHSRAQVIGISICAEEDKAVYIITYKWDPAANSLKESFPGVDEAVKKLLEDLKEKSLLMHNGVFDCAVAERYFKVSLINSLHTDTMILAHLLNENRRVGLKELASELFGEDATAEQFEMKQSVLANGGKLTKAEYEMYKADPYLMGKYAAKDAWLTYKLFYALVPDLVEQGLDKFFYEDESMPLLRGPTYQLNTIGLKVDQGSIFKLKKQLEAECMEARAFIYKEIDARIKAKYPGTKKTNTFNIGSSSQLSWLLFGEYGLEFGTLTKEGKNICKALGLRLPYTPAAKRDFIHTCTASAGQIYKPGLTVNGKVKGAKKYAEPWKYIACDKKTLTKLAPKYKWIERLLEYQRKTKILTTYVEGIEERIEYGIIHPSFLQHGTTSGRYSSRNPNFQNLPRDDKRVKSCIVARPGKVFVGADYSQLEPRVFAYTSGDKTLLSVFAGTEDFYSRIGMEVYEKFDCTPQKDGSDEAFGIKYKRLRDLSKVIALASTYGATAHQLAPTTSKSIDDTQQDIDSYFEKFPDVKKMMLDSHQLAKTLGEVTNIFGRPRRIPDAKKITKLYGNKEHAELPYEARKLLNLAVNHRIQSTGASIVNRSAIAFHNNTLLAGIECKLVVQVHDSLVVECNEADAEDVALILQDAMENTVELKGIKLEAIPKIGKNLSEV
jgi:DNA polymerase I-like protein with 3'-5' exonuclease and polymerase domains